MRRVLAAIAAALASLPKMVWKMVTVAGRTVMALVASPAPAADGPGFADDLAQAAEDQRGFAPLRCVESVGRGYAHAIRMGSPDRPDISGLPQQVQRWLSSLSMREAVAICNTRAVDRPIYRHVWAKSDGALIGGVRRLNGTWPPQTGGVAKIHAAIDDDAETVSAQHDPWIASMIEEVLADEDMHENGGKIVPPRKAA